MKLENNFTIDAPVEQAWEALNNPETVAPCFPGATLTSYEGDSFADDLDADSLALIELVEALEEELGERTVGFRIEDEDLEDLKTVRDAVDYVVAKLG